VAIRVRNAGIESVKSSHFSLVTAPHMSAPTMIRAGAVA
jgi:hypothetical protein